MHVSLTQKNTVRMAAFFQGEMPRISFAQLKKKTRRRFLLCLITVVLTFMPSVFFARVLTIKKSKPVNPEDDYILFYQQISGNYVQNNLLLVQYTAHLICMIF